MSKGTLTAQVAHLMEQEFNQQGFEVLHDHRQMENDSPDVLGKPRSWFGSGLRSGTVLADLDIAVVSSHDKKIYALVEVEETTAKPKVILGDILATLLGNGIAFQGKDLQVGEWTTLIVMAYDNHQSHTDSLAFLVEQINILKENLTTYNSKIGRIIVDAFADKMDLDN